MSECGYYLPAPKGARCNRAPFHGGDHLYYEPGAGVAYASPQHEVKDYYVTVTFPRIMRGEEMQVYREMRDVIEHELVNTELEGWPFTVSVTPLNNSEEVGP